MSKLQANQYFQQQIDEIDSLPPFPLFGNIIKSFLRADNVGDIRSLVSNIETEPSISAKLIGIANSAFYGGSDDIKNVREAIARIGILQLKSIIYYLVLSLKFNIKLCPHFIVSRFWIKSMMQAHCARNICKHLDFGKSVDVDEIYSIGLLQHIGLLAIIDLYPEKTESLLAHDTGESLNNKLLNAFGVNCYTASAMLLQHWALPRTFYNSIRHLNDFDYSGEDEALVWILQLSNEIWNDQAKTECSDLKSKLGNMISQSELCDILNDNEDDSRWVKSFAIHL